MAINVVSTKAEMEKHGALPWGSHALQWMSPVFPQVSTEIDNFLLCLSLERFKKKGGGVFLERRNLLLRCSSCPEVIRAGHLGRGRYPLYVLASSSPDPVEQVLGQSASYRSVVETHSVLGPTAAPG